MRKFLLFSGLLAVAAVSGQEHVHRTCGAQTITKRHLQAQGLSTDLLQAMPHLGAVERGNTYTVPVVVHVVYNTTAENVSTGTIQALIAELNADYTASNSDLSGVRSQFTSSIGDVGFNFCLAQVDPNGNATTGITRTQTSQTWFDPDTETNTMKSAPDGHAPWDPNRYLNIWICDITSGASGQTITVGYAYLPSGGVVGSNIDGLVIDYSYGTQPGDRTATHEIGHYFGLLHTFDDNGACVNADGFTDTPTTNSPTFSCTNTNLMKCGVLTQYENFMDYASCNRMFTNQQATYMAGILTGVRSQLLNNNACNTTPTGYCIPTSTNGTADGDFINGVQLGTINNTNSGGPSAPTYTNYSGSQGTNLLIGTAYSISITGGTFQPDAYAAWIDYNQNDVFDASEKLGEFNTTVANQTQVINFNVPANATTGTTRLRVRGVYHNTGEPNPTDPCYNYAYGETEDYGITIMTPVTGPCIPTSANGTSDGDFVDGVQLGTMNNTNSGGNGTPTYRDYTSTYSASLARGSSQNIIITGGDYQPDSYAAWIDYDQDDTFEASEKLGEFATTAIGQSQSIAFVVPAGAALGNTVLRVRGVYHDTGEPNPTDPCFAYAFGETEDYRITITSASTGGPCVPTSANGTIDGDYIDIVSLENILNLNSGDSLGPSYSDLQATYNTNLARNGQYGMIVGSGSYTSDNYAVWIDYNQNDVFDTAEKLGEFSTTASFQTGLITFTVPATAILGQTTMRVRGVYFNNGEPNPVDPCFNYAFGETEDYRITITAPITGYCVPTSFQGTVDGDFINGVQLGTINNANSGGDQEPTYTNFTSSFSTPLARGIPQTLRVQSGTYTADNYAAWIDYNNNQQFEASEKLGEVASTVINEDLVINFTVPANATLGATRMRVRGTFHLNGEPTPTDPCYSYAYGETEDYGINIETNIGLNDLDHTSIQLFPNPTNGVVNLVLPTSARSSINIMDMQGRVVIATQRNAERITMDLSGIAEGVYLVHVQQNGEFHTERMEVLHQEE